MPMKKNVLPSMFFLGTCPLCHKRLKDDTFSVIDKNATSILCYITCTSCLSSLLFTVSLQEEGMMTTIGVLTDIQKEDLDMIKKKIPLNYNDVLDMHTYFESSTTEK